ncbi:surface protease GP63, partial [Trypanosoma rangeli]
WFGEPGRAAALRKCVALPFSSLFCIVFFFSYSAEKAFAAATNAVVPNKRRRCGQFLQAVRRPRYLAPCFPLALLLLLLAVQCAGGCLAVAAPAREGRGRFDELLWKSGRSPTAVVRELPRKGQGAMQAYTVAAKEEGNSGWAPIRIFVSTEDLRDPNKYCNEIGVSRTDLTRGLLPCQEQHVLKAERKKKNENFPLF